MRTVRVDVSGSYEILIGPGLIDEAGQRIAKIIAPCKVALITDDLVDSLYGERVEKSLGAAGFAVRKFAFKNGEASKNLSTLTDILERMGEWKLNRSDIVICLGGGVVGDMGGFAAATYARGIRFVQMPTTLLAAVDSSVGGKTAVNLGAAKNMAGAFAQPSLVLCDTDVMRDLPGALLRDGAGEIIKHGVLADPALLQLIAEGRLEAEMDDVIARNVEIKREYVQSDEFDRGRRQLLNLGHTIGHAVEKRSNFVVPHGQAVGIGLMAIACAAWALGISEEKCEEPIGAALGAVGLATECPYTKAELLDTMMMDKKRAGADITLAVPIRIGHCELMTVPAETLGEWLTAGGIA